MGLMEIRFDGGCKPNPGMKYGSFMVKWNGQTVALRKNFPLGRGTNNEAELGVWAERNGYIWKKGWLEDWKAGGLLNY